MAKTHSVQMTTVCAPVKNKEFPLLNETDIASEIIKIVQEELGILATELPEG